jgi:hypothetical protein
MKIVMLSSTPPPDARAYKEISSLKKKNNVTYAYWNRDLKKHQMTETNVLGINLKAGLGFSSVWYKYPFFWIRAIKKLKKQNLDVIHTYNFDMTLIGFYFKYILKKKWVYDSRDLYHTYFIKKGKEGILAKLIKKIDIWMAKKCDMLIVPTEKINKIPGLKEFYIKNGVNKNKITTIWNVPNFSMDVRVNKIEKKVIGYIGAQRTYENFKILFDSITKDYSVLFVGTGKETENLKRLSKNYKFKVEFVESSKYVDILKYYQKCSIIYSVIMKKDNIKNDISKQGSLSTKVIEATFLGIPVIISSNMIDEDFVNKYKCGIILDGLTIDNVKKALNDIEKIKFDSNIIRKEWNWNNEKIKLLKVYEKLK